MSLESFTLDSTATLAMELGGTAAGSQYDQLNFTGAGVLGGSLDVSLTGGFTPQQGQAFTLFSGGTLSGAFSSIQLPDLVSGLAWNTSQLYTTGILAVGLAGDFNGDGVVDTADYVVWRKGLDTIYSPSDYNVWRSNFGQTAGSGAGAVVSTAVPEPTTLVLLLVGIVTMQHRRRSTEQ